MSVCSPDILPFCIFIYIILFVRVDRFVPDMKRLLVDWHEGRLTGKPGYRSTKDRCVLSKALFKSK